MEALRFEEVSFKYAMGETPVLKEISLSLPAGGFGLILGPTGCGKSTLFRLIKNSLRPQGDMSGKIRIFGRDTGDMSREEEASLVGFVGQDPEAGIVTETVWQELAFGLENLGTDRETIGRRVAEMASFFGIGSWFRRKTGELSGGEKQLLSLASTMTVNPRLLILDEPTSQLDPVAAAEFLDFLRRINTQMGTTILITEHRSEEIYGQAGHVFLMEVGSIVKSGPPRDVAKSLILEKGHELLSLYLPSATRIYEMAGLKGELPVTVAEGRTMVEEFKKEVPFKNLADEPESKPTEVIGCRDIWFCYDRGAPDIVRGADLSVGKGEIFALLGSNGSGKTSLLKLIAGGLKPYRGRVSLKGRGAVLFQSPMAMFTAITVEEEVFYSIPKDSGSEKERIEKGEKLLKTMGLWELRDMHPYDISGGQKQLLALSKVLAVEPEVLLLDEPTKGLDPLFKRKIGDLLKKLSNSGVTLFMVSHDVEFCAEYSDRCALLFDGGIMGEGSPQSFFGENLFYTTAANRIAKEFFPRAILCREVAECLGDS